MGRQPRGAYSIVTGRVSKASQEPRRGLERGTVDPSEDCVHVPLVPCRRHRSLVGPRHHQRRSVLLRGRLRDASGCAASPFTVIVDCTSPFYVVGVYTSAVCTRPMTERTVGSTAIHDERLHASPWRVRSLFGYAPVGWQGFRTPPDVRQQCTARRTMPGCTVTPPPLHHGPTDRRGTCRRAPEGRTAASRPRGERSTLGIRSPPAKTPHSERTLLNRADGSARRAPRTCTPRAPARSSSTRRARRARAGARGPRSRQRPSRPRSSRRGRRRHPRRAAAPSWGGATRRPAGPGARA